jgi:5'-nucleotidase
MAVGKNEGKALGATHRYERDSMTKTLDATPEVERNNQRIVYVDMDDTLCDYSGGYLSAQASRLDIPYPQSLLGFYLGLEPLPGAVEGFNCLRATSSLDVYILTAPSVMNPHSYSEKRQWVERHLGLEVAYRLIICPNKGLLKGDILIDDNIRGKGQEHFAGEVYQFGSAKYPNWKALIQHFQR